MRKQRHNKKFGRVKAQRKAMFNSLLSALIQHGSITTTEVKAKAIKPKIEKLITHAKKNSLAKIRLVRKQLSEQTTKRLFNEIAKKYKDRHGGYTRIYKMPPRLSDSAKMAKIEFI